MIRIFASVARIFAIFFLFAAPSFAQNYRDDMMFRICNREGDVRVDIAFAEKFPLTEGIDGWFYVEPSTCVDIHRNSSQYVEHHLFFRAEGKLLDLSFRNAGSNYCIDVTGRIDLFESVMMDPGRTKRCQGNEKLVRAPLRVLGAERGYTEILIPAFSSVNSPTDNKTCFLGICF